MKAIPLLTICSACVLVTGCASDSVRTVSKTEQSCPVTVYYEANYNLAYLKDARLLLTTEGHPTDIVNLRKNVEPATLADPASDSEPKIRDMVNRLLPRGTPW